MPGTPYLSKDTGTQIMKVVAAIACIQLAMVVYVIYMSYEGRVRVVKSQRAGCERAKADRNANARGWRIAQAARTQSGDLVVAEAYSNIAAGQEKRSRIVCKEAFPNPGFLP
jgi:hypothetical protein